MKKLTHVEVETFTNIIKENMPLLLDILNKNRNIVDAVRKMEMTDENLAYLEFITEKTCKLYIVKKMWEEIDIKSLPVNPSESLCEYVREVIHLFKNFGETPCVN